MANLLAYDLLVVLHEVDPSVALDHAYLLNQCLGVLAEDLDSLTANVEPIEGCSLS